MTNFKNFLENVRSSDGEVQTFSEKVFVKKAEGANYIVSQVAGHKETVERGEFSKELIYEENEIHEEELSVLKFKNISFDGFRFLPVYAKQKKPAELLELKTQHFLDALKFLWHSRDYVEETDILMSVDIPLDRLATHVQESSVSFPLCRHLVFSSYSPFKFEGPSTLETFFQFPALKKITFRGPNLSAKSPSLSFIELYKSQIEELTFSAICLDEQRRTVKFEEFPHLKNLRMIIAPTECFKPKEDHDPDSADQVEFESLGLKCKKTVFENTSRFSLTFRAPVFPKTLKLLQRTTGLSSMLQNSTVQELNLECRWNERDHISNDLYKEQGFALVEETVEDVITVLAVAWSRT